MKIHSFFVFLHHKYKLYTMELSEIISYIVGSGGAIGLFLTLYTAKIQKKKIQVEVTQLLNDEWESLFDKLKQDTSNKIENLENKILRLEMKDDIKNRAINQFVKCMYVQRGSECPVAIFMEKTDDILRSRLTPEQLAELNGRKS